MILSYLYILVLLFQKNNMNLSLLNKPYPYLSFYYDFMLLAINYFRVKEPNWTAADSSWRRQETTESVRISYSTK